MIPAAEAGTPNYRRTQRNEYNFDVRTALRNAGQMGAKTNGGSKRKVGKNFRDFRVVGRTTEGKRVIGGIFPIVSSEGIPLEVILGDLDRKGCVIDWYDFWKESVSSGWNPRSTITKITTAVGDVQGPKIKEKVGEMLEFLYKVEMATQEDDEDEVKRLLLERRETDRKEQRTRLINTIKHMRA